jgi:ketosteroid isomerase-like protein
VAVAELFHIEIRPNTEERNIAMHDARAFAEDWIAAWNAHDLDRILSHYAPEVAFLSPVAQKRVGNGRVEGLAALRGYWSGALAAQPGLKFELLDMLTGHACLTVLYRNHRGQTAAETFEFRSDGKVVRSFACYLNTHESAFRLD